MYNKEKGLLNMNISEFDYELPEELIAQMPSDKRENARMLVLDKKTHSIEDKHFLILLIILMKIVFSF